MLELRNVGLSHGATRIVTRADLRVGAGHCVGLVGASGAGKSLLASAILGLLPPAITLHGTILWHGRTISNAPDADLAAIRGREIGIVFQNTSAALDPLITIGDQLADLFARHRNLTSAAAVSAARAVFRQVEWPDAIDPFDRYPHEVSGGQRQRALIAMAIALQPHLIIADEPTASLDVTTAKAMLDLLKRIARENGSSLLVISHDLPALATCVDATAHLHDGVLDGTHPVASLHDRESGTSALAALFRRSMPQRPQRPAEHGSRDPALRIADLHVVYRKPRLSLFEKAATVHALRGITCTIGKGEAVALVGESGSGKSTLARAVMGLEKPQSGTISVLGLDPHNAATRQRLWHCTRFVFQDPFASVDPNWTVRAIVGEALALRGDETGAAGRDARISAALAEVGIAPALYERFPHQLSGGQLQRVALARALVTRPDILILDEPISALDADARGQILSLLHDLARKTDLTTLLITHDLGVARAYADRVIVMKDGTIVEEGEIMAVLDRPQHAYTAALMAASPMLNADRIAPPDLAGRPPQG